MAFSQHFARTDHVALVPRRLASVYFRFAEEVSCAWIEGKERRLAARGAGPWSWDFVNEHVLAAWLVHHGASLKRLHWPGE